MSAANFEEIRARSERMLAHLNAFGNGQNSFWEVPRDVLLLVEVAEAARTLITNYSDLGHSDEYLEGGLVSNYDRDLARLEEALKKVAA